MRKIDYYTLAQIIRQQSRGAKHCAAQTDRAHADREYFRGAQDAAYMIARRFADRASVDRLAFLRACGIEP